VVALPNAPAVSPGSSASRTPLLVSVKVSVRDPNLLLVRLLPDGKAPPPGTRSAFLLLTESDTDRVDGSSGGNAP
jgi:hypothetical protein